MANIVEYYPLKTDAYAQVDNDLHGAEIFGPTFSNNQANFVTTHQVQF